MKKRKTLGPKDIADHVARLAYADASQFEARENLCSWNVDYYVDKYARLAIKIDRAQRRKKK